MVSFVVACGAGCLVRYGAEWLAGALFSNQRLWGTLAVNIAGCFVAGFLLTHLVAHNSAVLPFCGGLTSYSAAFAGPLHAIEVGQRRTGVVTLVATPLLCVIACFIGAGI